MAGNVSVPNSFGSQAGNIPLSELDANFAALVTYANDPTNRVSIGIDSGVANGYIITPTPSLPNYTNPALIWFIPANSNSASSTANVSGKGALNIYKDSIGGPVLLTGTEIIAGNFVGLLLDPTLNGSAGGFHLVTPPLNASPASSVVGSVRNLKAVFGSSTTMTVAADQATVYTALAGVAFGLANFSLTLNVGTTGAGGMDVASTLTNADLSVYLIWNPSTSTVALLGTLGSTSNGSIYAGAHMPSGFTASALVSSQKMNGSGQFNSFIQRDRHIDMSAQQAFAGTVTTPGTLQTLSLSSVIPSNATIVRGSIGVTAASSAMFEVAADTSGTAAQFIGGAQAGTALGGLLNAGVFSVAMSTAQQIAWTSAVAAAMKISVHGYDF